MAKGMSVDTLVSRFATIKSNRAMWENHWQEIQDRALPQLATVTTSRVPGTNLSTIIYDSSAIYAAQILASGLHSYLTNPTSRWFSLAMQDRDLMELHSVKTWLKKSEDLIFSYLNGSNFSQAIHEAYIQFAVIGNCCLYEDEDIKKTIKFAARDMSEIFILVNASGEIDTVYRSFMFTARQAYQRWGENAGKAVKDLIDAKKIEEKVAFLHIVMPREDREVGKKDAKNMPFASIYIEPKNKKVLEEGGYHEFPFFTPRFYKISESEYAYGPGSLALADIKTLQSMDKTILKGAQKAVDPVVIIPTDGYLLPFKNSAGAINFKNQGTRDNSKIEILDIKRDIGIGLEMENQRRTQIERAFFVDLFLMLAQNPNMTATEVLERVQEKMLILGPVLGRLMHELLDPIVTRTFGILARAGKLPLPPEEIPEGEEFKIKYISPLAKAQRAEEGRSISAVLLAVGQMAELDETVKDNINFDRAIHEIAEIANVSAEIMNSEEEKEFIREQRQKAVELQQSLDQMKLGAEGLKAVGEAEQILKGGDKVNA